MYKVIKGLIKTPLKKCFGWSTLYPSGISMSLLELRPTSQVRSGEQTTQSHKSQTATSREYGKEEGRMLRGSIVKPVRGLES